MWALCGTCPDCEDETVRHLLLDTEVFEAHHFTAAADLVPAMAEAAEELSMQPEGCVGCADEGEIITGQLIVEVLGEEVVGAVIVEHGRDVWRRGTAVTETSLLLGDVAQCCYRHVWISVWPARFDGGYNTQQKQQEPRQKHGDGRHGRE
jgi:hypothetical protein